MSLLAEPRRKRRMHIDPQNLKWKNDTNRISHKLMSKMGWSEGKGLGANEQGAVDNIKLKANFTSKGLGHQGSSDADKTWISHHDEFSSLLQSLSSRRKVAQQEEEEVESSDDDSEVTEKVSAKDKGVESLETKSKQTKTRIHYRYTRMKDLSRYTDQDKSAVIGIGLKGRQQPKKEEESSVVPKKNVEDAPTVEKTESGENEKSALTASISSVSLTDYFASKMAKFYAVKSGLDTVESSEGVETVDIADEAVVDAPMKKKKKSARKIEENAENTIDEALEVEKKHKKQRKGSKENVVAEEVRNENSEVEEVIEPERKKKKRRREEIVVQDDADDCADAIVEQVVSKKKKKRRKAEFDVVEEAETVVEEEEVVTEKPRKNKKKKHRVEEDE